jgi:hypothetical protein
MLLAKPKRKGRLTDAHFPVPARPSDEALRELLEPHGFEGDQIKRMVRFLRSLIDRFVVDMKSANRRKTRKADRRNLEVSANKINDVIWHLNACGFYGREMAEDGLAPLGEMFAVSWLREAFPDADNLPSREHLSAGDARTPVRLTPVRGRLRRDPVYIEERTREARYYFAREQNLSLVNAALSEILKSLNDTLRRRQKGREPCTFREAFLLNLARAWKGIGRDPHTRGPFGFCEFCEDIFEKIGWPIGGIRRAIDKALADRRAVWPRFL